MPTANHQPPSGHNVVWVLSRARAVFRRRGGDGWQRWGGPIPLVFILGVVLASVANPVISTSANWTDQSTVTGTAVSTGTLAPPTSLAVTQACIADPTPVRRSGAGGVASSTSTNGTLSIPKPTSTVTGDVLIAGISWNGNHSSATPTAPAGWTLIRAERAAEMGLFIYYKVATASEAAPYSWTGLTLGAAGGMAAYSGVDTAAPINSHSGAITETAPSLTTTRDNVLLVGNFGVISAAVTSVPGTMTSLWSAYSGAQPADQQVGSAGAQESWPTSGATGSRTMTAPGNGSRKMAQLVALQPPAYPQATVTWTPSTSTFATGQNYTRSPGGTPATLGPSVSSRVTGLLTSGTAYTVGITATYESWLSTTSSIGFTARSCWPA